MPITEKQLESRRSSIGSSDMAAIMGFSPFKTTPWDVWADKRGLVPKQETPWFDAGHRLERFVLEWAQTELGPLRRNQRRVKPEYHLAANVDAIVVADGMPVEAKTSGIIGPVFGEWGEEGSSEIPDHVIIQCHVHMICTDRPVCHVPVLLGGCGRGYVMFKVPYVDVIGDKIKQEACGFWACVESGIPPPDSVPSEHVYRTLRREPSTWADVTVDAIARYESAKAARLESEKAEAEAKAEIMRQIGTAEGARLEDGRLLTYFEQQRKESFIPASTFRVLRIKKGK